MTKEMNAREFVIEKLRYNGVEIYPSSYISAKDLFYFLVYFKEGLSLEGSMSENILKYAKEVLEENQEMRERIATRGWGDLAKTKAVYERINELKNGDINFSDFNNGQELADYLIKGV